MSIWAIGATQMLASTFQQYGYRLNRVAPLDGSEPFTGDVTFEANVQIDGTLSVTGAVDFAGPNTFSYAGSAVSWPIMLNSTLPGMMWYESDAAANNRAWRMYVLSEQFRFDVTSDTGSGSGPIFTVDRSANVIDNITFPTAVSITGAITHTYSGNAVSGLYMESTVPVLGWYDTDATANNRRWIMYANADGFRFETRSDDGSTAVAIMAIERTGNTVDSVILSATVVDVTTSSGMVQRATGGTWATNLIEAPSLVVERSVKIARAASANLQFWAFGNTLSSPAALTSGQIMADIRGMGYQSGSVAYLAANIYMIATENWSTSVSGSAITFWTTATGAVTMSERARISSTGAWQVTGGFGAGFAAAAGAEMGVQSGEVYWQAYNRGTSAYIVANHTASQFNFLPAGTIAAKIFTGEFRILGDTTYMSWFNGAESTRRGYIQGVSTGMTFAMEVSAGVMYLAHHATSAAYVMITGAGNTPATTYATSGRGTLVMHGASDSIIEFRAGSTNYGYVYCVANEFRLQAVGGSCLFTIYNNGTLALTLGAGGALRLNAYGAGTLTTDASGNVTAVSDIRAKKFVKPWSRGLAEVMLLEPISYKYRADTKLDQSHEYVGFSAQDVLESIPEAVHVRGEEDMMTFSDRPIIAALVNAVKELSAELQTLRGQLNERPDPV